MSIDLLMLSNHVILCQPFSFCLQPFPDQGLSNELSGGQSIGTSASILPMNIQDWFHLGLTGLMSLPFKGFSRIFSSATIQKYQFFSPEGGIREGNTFKDGKRCPKRRVKRSKIGFTRTSCLGLGFSSENFKCCFVILSAYWNQAASKQLLHMGAPLATECQEAWVQTQWQRMRSRTGL